MSNQNADQARENARYAAIDQDTPVIIWYGTPRPYADYTPPPDIIPPALQCGALRPRPLRDYENLTERSTADGGMYTYYGAPVALYVDGRRVLSLTLDGSGREYTVERYQDVRALIRSAHWYALDQADQASADYESAAPGSGERLLYSGRARICARLYGEHALDQGGGQS